MKTTPVATPVSRRRFLGQLTVGAALAMTPRWIRAADDSSPLKTLGVALVGLGRYSTYALGPALLKTRHCRLRGVVTGTRAKGEKWARDYGFPEKNIFSYDTMSQIAGNPDIDIIYVVTPNGLHAEHVIAAAKTGKHVICEKPMATSVADCDAMIAACSAAGVRLMIGYRLRYEPHYVEFARLARENAFGPFKRISGANGFQMDSSDAGWRVTKKLSGGGPLMDMGVYVIQAACMAKAESAPAAVTATFGPVTEPGLFAEVEESVAWTMEFADGAVAKCTTSYADNVSRFRAEADHGWAQLEDPAFYYDPLVLTTSRGRANFPNLNHQVAQLDGMALELLADWPSRAPGEMGRRDVAIIYAIYAAANSGGRVELKV